MTLRRIVLLLFLSLTAAAQQQPRAGETIDVTIVNVDVVVTDASGKRVSGLTADDFEIREGGKLQPVTHFSAYAPAPRDASKEAVATTELSRPPRTVVVFIESSELMPEEVDELYDAIRRLLRDTVTAPHDRAAVVGWQSNAATVRQPFTRNLDVLEKVLAKMQRGHKVAPRDHHGQEALAREVQEEQAAGAEMLEAGALAPEEEGEFGDMQSIHELEDAMRQLARIHNKSVAIEALLNSMGALEGRKIAVLAMNRFGLFAGAEGTESGSVPFDARRKLTNKKAHDTVIRAANANDVVLYPFYPAGVKWNGMDITRRDPYSDDERLKRDAKQHNILLNEAMALEELAKTTGGLMAWGTRNIAELLPRVADDLETYYSLGYRATSSGADVTRQIEVRTKNKDYRVRSRTQFVEKSEETLAREQVLAHLYHGLGESTFDVEVVFGKRRGDMVPFTIRVAAHDLPELPAGEKKRALTFYVATTTALGVASDVQQRTHSFPLPKKDGDEVAHFTADFTLRADATPRWLSVGVRDDLTRELGVKRLPLR